MVDSTTSNNKRIAKNTLFLFFRMLLTMAVSLYTSRVVLNTLGVEDYGIYNAVGGFVALFAVVSNSLSASISRFITYELGKVNRGKVNEIFSTAVFMQFVISSCVIFLSITVGAWFLNYKMTIPEERLFAANCVFYLSVITFVVNLISVPYNACIIAYERMKAFAYIGIVEAVGRLGIAFAIMISSIDKLILYASLMCIFAVFIRLLYGWYCKRNFIECHFKWHYDKSLIKEIFCFAGWNFIGAASGVLKDQGINVLLNIFCGPAVNAARGIAIQVSTAVTQFSSNFMTAINPQITKSFAAKEYDYSFNLICKSARFSFFLLFIISLPVLLETNTILTLWLKIVPDHLINFTRLVLSIVLIDSLSQGLVTLMLATGRIKIYQLIVGGCVFMNFPLSYILLKNACEPEMVFILSLLISIICLLLRLVMLNQMINFPVRKFIKHVISPIIKVVFISLIILLGIIIFQPNTAFRLFLNILLCIFISSFTIYAIGCTSSERLIIKEKFAKLIRQIR